MGDISRVVIDPNANKEGMPIGDMYTIHTKYVNPNILDYLDTKDVSSVK